MHKIFRVPFARQAHPPLVIPLGAAVFLSRLARIGRGRARLVLGLIAFGLGPNTVRAAPPDDTVVFDIDKPRVHVAECPRFRSNLETNMAVAVRMTYGEAKAMGKDLCSRCPGSPNAGERGRGLESWVKPAPTEITQHPFETHPLTPLVAMGPSGRLQYKPYTPKGDQIMDWSHTGYKNSNVPLPEVPVVETLVPSLDEAVRIGNMAYPQGSDSRAEIQAAIDRVAAREANADGIRGAVLLKRGTHYANGSLVVRSGVVLRGEGDGKDGTVLIMTSAKGGDNAIHLGHPEANVETAGEGEATRITDAYLPSGSLRFTVADASGFKPGDNVHVRKTTNQAWIDLLGMGQRLQHIRGGKEGEGKRPWTPEAYQIRHLRKIAAIDGNRITLDGILPQSFDQEHGGGDLYKVDVSSLGTQSGVEFLRIVSNYDTTVKDSGKDANFLNFHSAIAVGGAYDSWVRGCTMLHVAFAAVAIGNNTRQITVRDCKNLQPVGPKRGGLRYAFSIGGGTLHLFYNCHSEDGRHDFAIGSRETGPFAFVKCVAVRGGQSEPHHRWSTGILYDNVITRDGTLAAINRGDSGSGHGWAAANTMFWNCDAKSIVVMDPETEGENNFAIGYRGTFDPATGTDALRYANDRAGYWGTPQEGKFFGYALMGSGHIESPDRPVVPDSLFIQQLIDRIGAERAAAVLK